MTELEEMIDELKSEIEKRSKDSTEQIMDELEAEEDLVREVARQGFPGDTLKNTEELEILANERKALNRAKTAIKTTSTLELRVKATEIREERQETDRKGSEEIMYGYSATVQSLEEAEKLLKGEEYQAEGLGKSAAFTFPNPQRKIEDQIGLKNELLKEFREKNIHLLLRCSKTLGEANVKHGLEDKDLEKVKTLREELRQRFRKMATDLDYLITNAAFQLEKTRRKKRELESSE